MDGKKPYAKPAVRSVSAQEYCAHCIDAVPVGVFQIDGKPFALCRRCSTFLKVKEELPPIAPSERSKSYFNTATRFPDLDEIDRQGVASERDPAWRCRQRIDA